jgi:hypothetical protein
MFIHSKHRDYYDNILSHLERDPKIVYKREETQIPISDAFKELRRYTRELSFSIPLRQRTETVNVILFCGKVFPFYHKEGEYGNRPFKKEEDVFNYTSPYEKFPPEKEKTRYLSEYQDLAVPESYQGEGIEHPHALKLNRELAPVILIRATNRQNVTLNPILKTWAFPLHAHTVVQCLMSFLAPVEPQMVQTEDKYRVAAHGFDKGSFRKEAGGPTRKRKKILAE